MKKINKLQNELNFEIKKIKKTSAARRLLVKNYMSCHAPSKWDYLGYSVPRVRSILKKDLSVHKENFQTQYQVFEKNWFDSKSFDQKSLSLYWLESLTHDQLLEIASSLVKWSSIIDNWAHADGLCSTYAKIYEKNPSLLHSTYKNWNLHKNPWLRRISMVGLMYYSRLRKAHPTYQQCTEFIEPHLRAPEYYVQKAVGWTLREMYNVYPQKTIRYIEKNIASISSIAWVAASEKLEPLVKKKLLAKRKTLKRSA